MVEVVLLGQPFAAARVAGAINKGGDDFHARVINGREHLDLLARPPRSDRLVAMRVGYRVGAPTSRGRLFDAYWSLLRRRLPRARFCHYWLGSDVMRTVEDAASGVIQAGPLRASLDDLHLSVAPWLTAELEPLGIHATTAFIPAPLRIPDVAPDLPQAFGVLSYLPNHRFAFFGGETLMDTARRLPDVRFDVVAGTAEAAPSAPPNVRWHGWVADMAERYRAATVVVRIPRHDGFGNSVIEGLLNARHIIYTHAVPFVQQVSPVSDAALAAAIGSMFAAHQEGTLVANTAGRDYAVEAFDPMRLGHELRELLRADP